jgi:hypothetical protein
MASLKELRDKSEFLTKEFDSLHKERDELRAKGIFCEGSK